MIQIVSAFDEDYGIVPSEKSILEERIPLPFRVKNRHKKDGSTHKLEWVVTGKDYPYSFPILQVEPLYKYEIEGIVEVTFDYNKSKKKVR